VPLGDEALNFFKRRGISIETLERNRVEQENLYSPADKGYVDAVAFTYRRKDKVVNVKYRKLPKTFWQVCMHFLVNLFREVPIAQ
jgi:hypothetical protein